MTIEMEEATRKQVAVFMPKAIDKALQSYYDFASNEEVAEEGKSREKKFAEHHGACKIALSHLELLIKLASVAKVDTGERGVTAQLLLQARNETNTYRDEMVPDEGEEDYQKSV